MTSPSQLMTAAELWQMPADGARCELVEGQLLMMSPAGGRHGRIALKLARRLGDHVERRDLAVGFRLDVVDLFA